MLFPIGNFPLVIFLCNCAFVTAHLMKRVCNTLSTPKHHATTCARVVCRHSFWIVLWFLQLVSTGLQPSTSTCGHPSKTSPQVREAMCGVFTDICAACPTFSWKGKMAPPYLVPCGIGPSCLVHSVPRKASEHVPCSRPRICLT